LILWLNQQLRSLLRKHQSKNPAFFLQELLLPRERERGGGESRIHTIT
jgi:hypothetical protein